MVAMEMTIPMSAAALVKRTRFLSGSETEAFTPRSRNDPHHRWNRPAPGLDILGADLATFSGKAPPRCGGTRLSLVVVFGTLVFCALAGVLFIAFVGLELAGRVVGARRLARNPEGAFEGNAVVEGSLLALLGLLIAFTFSNAQTRYDARRQMIVEEANAIDTAYLRLDLLPLESQGMLRDDFRRYVDARISYYEHLLHRDERRLEHARAAGLQDQIWRDVIDATRDGPDSRAALLLVPAVNQMIDLTTVRDVALTNHTPILIFVLLFLLELACAFFAGLNMAKNKSQNRFHVLAFAATLALTAYAILDLEFPRLGFTNLSHVDALLIQVRATML
jgi:hypothetical protein